MLQSYKLRLGDGTVLLVDHDGLSTWLVDRKATVQAGRSHKWLPLKEFLAQERVRARLEARRRAAQRETAPPATPTPAAEGPAPREDGLPLVPPPPPMEVVPAALPLTRDDVPMVPLPPGPEPQPLAPPLSPGFEPSPVLEAPSEVEAVARVTVGEPRLVGDADLLAAPAPVAVAEPSPVNEPPGVQALAEDPAGPAPVEHEAAPIAELPVIPLKPFEAPDRRAVTSRPSSPRRAVYTPARTTLPTEDFKLDPRLVLVLRSVGALGTFLSRCLAPINRLEQGRPLLPEEHHAWLEDDLISRVSRRRWELLETVGGWRGRLTAQITRFVRPKHSPPSIPADEPGAPVDGAFVVGIPVAVDPLALDPVAPEPIARPDCREALPAVSALPVLRLKPIDDSQVAEDVYEDDEGESVASVTWLWTKRLAWATALLLIGAFAIVSRKGWLPPAAEIGERGLIQIDEQVRATHFARQQQRAVTEAAGELPHLAPETIRLVMSSSPIRVLDARAVFEVACDAADRGRSALTVDEAEELRALRQELLDALGPSERDRISEFERARARGAVFPPDADRGLRTYARGARAMGAESRERLRELLGRAIAAGLAHPGETAPAGP